MNFLIFGDVVGRIGREGLTRLLPELRQEHKPDALIVNIENISHGKGISPQTMAETQSWQAAAFTTGDHAWDNEAGIPLLNDKNIPIVRPANYPEGVSGRGWLTFTNGAYQVAVINLQGQVKFRNDPANPFHALDQLLNEPDIKSAQVVLVDFHAEITAEKRALGWYADGRISALWGTHTHVPTADAQILPKGTGYITDVGMCGGLNSIIGQEPSGPLKAFQTQIKHKFEPPTEGPVEINGLALEIDPSTGHTTALHPIRKILPN
jgi:2',3'-cyclic-nucleotide 2'-phosphodiesterase